MNAAIDSEEFFLAESLRHAATLPMSQADAYLRGMLTSCSGAIELPSELIALIRTKLQTDEQLELIASDQLKFRELLKS